MIRITFVCCFFFSLVAHADAQTVKQIKVNPIGVNVNAQGATTAFLTFGPISDYRPVEECWAGNIIPAAPDIGFKADPATLFGCLPIRYDRSTVGSNQALTDIMSIPASVARRAYQDAAAGAESRFFYVRRFVSMVGGPDQYVPVTCRLTSGNSRSPFSLTDVKVLFEGEKNVMLVKSGETLPSVRAEITFTGTGRLKGRWEVVSPGEQIPSESDLLTEATLPIEKRANQRRFTELSRFNVFLAPTGRHSLAGPDVSKIPTTAEGRYMILLRVEASDDREADSDLSAVEGGTGIVHSGAVAGFPLPVLQYYVGSGTASSLTQLTPSENHVQQEDLPLDFRWSTDSEAAVYRLELSKIERSNTERSNSDPSNRQPSNIELSNRELSTNGEIIFSALVSGLISGSASGTERTYRAPSWLASRYRDQGLMWRVISIDKSGVRRKETPWRILKFSSKR